MPLKFAMLYKPFLSIKNALLNTLTKNVLLKRLMYFVSTNAGLKKIIFALNDGVSVLWQYLQESLFHFYKMSYHFHKNILSFQSMFFFM